VELLTGFDLSALGDDSALRERIRGLLATTKAQIDSAAGRDFGVHSEDTAVVDGTGHDCVFLFRSGYRPILSVRSLTVEGEVVPAGDYVVYGASGYIRLKPRATWGTRFPEGLANVQVALDWGYEVPPADIAAAQAKLTATQLLARASSAGAGGTVSKRIGEYSVTYSEGGPYAATISQWVDDVEAAVARHWDLRVSSV